MKNKIIKSSCYTVVLTFILIFFLTHCEYSSNNAGSGCGQTFTEDDATNGGPAPIANDFGIVLEPGCTVTIKGSLTGLGGEDYFKIFVGNVDAIFFHATWDNLTDILDLYVIDTSDNIVATSIGYAGGTEQLLWKVDIKNYIRFIDVHDFGSTVSGNYTLTITAF
ncbi:MAG: hypothetical protein OEV44_10955 [Spirochaetota bacterium]|nr:hypothetical protein [Spirochaetota bacterium]